MPSNKLRILLADDHAVVREGLKRLISSEPDMEVVGEASDGSEVMAKVVESCPAVVVIDVSMGKVGGAEAALTIKASNPAIKVLVLTVHEDASYLRELLAAGASGYVLKRAAPSELIAAIRAITAGGLYVDARLTGQLSLQSRLSPPNPLAAAKLTNREAAVIRLVARGYLNKEIGSELQISVKTAETHRANAMVKLGLKSRIDIVNFALMCGWLPTPAAARS